VAFPEIDVFQQSELRALQCCLITFRPPYRFCIDLERLYIRGFAATPGPVAEAVTSETSNETPSEVRA
jgi:hypothetical protein